MENNGNNNNVDGYEDGEKPIIFHYGKPGERLKNAEESVRKFYAGEGPQPPKGLFRSLVQTKASRFMFFTVIAFVVFFFGIQFLTGDPSQGTLSGIPVSASAFSFEDTIYISIKMEAVRNAPDTIIPVKADVRLFDKNKQLVNTVIIDGFYSGKEEFLRTIVTDYDIVYIEADVYTPNSSVTVTAGVTGH